MISGRQIASARTLIGWSQDVLAAESGVTRSAIQKIERQEVDQPRISTISKIINALEEKVEFIEDGVRLRKGLINIIEGDDFYIKILDDVYYTLKDQPNAEFLCGFIDNSLSPPAVISAEKRLRDAGIKFRHITKQGNEYLLYPLNEYRYFPAKDYENYNILIYGEKVALMINKNTKAMIIHDPNLSTIIKSMFNFIWKNTHPPIKSIAQLEQ